MKTLIISEKKDIYSVQRLKAELERLNHDVDFRHPFQSASIIIGSNSPIEKKYDLVFNRISGVRFDDFDLDLQRTYEKLNSLALNPSYALKELRDKTSQLILLNDLNAPIIPSLFLRGKIDKNDLLEKLSQINAKHEFIVKTQRGNQGLGVNLLRGLDSLLAFLETFWAIGDQRLIIQPMIKFKKEMRLFFVKGEFIAGLEKTLSYKNGFKSNSNEAISKNLNLKNIDSSLINDAKNIMDKLDLFYAGLDYALTENGEIKLLEINPCPGFEILENVSSKNMAQEIVIRAIKEL